MRCFIARVAAAVSPSVFAVSTKPLVSALGVSALTQKTPSLVFGAVPDGVFQRRLGLADAA